MSKYLKQKMIHEKLIDLIMNAAHENTTIKEVKEIAAKVTTIMRTTHYKEHEKQIIKIVKKSVATKPPLTFDEVFCPECKNTFKSYPAGVSVVSTACVFCRNDLGLRRTKTVVQSAE